MDKRDTPKVALSSEVSEQCKMIVALAIHKYLPYVKPHVADVVIVPKENINDFSWKSGNSEGNQVEVGGSLYYNEEVSRGRVSTRIRLVKEDHYKDSFSHPNCPEYECFLNSATDRYNEMLLERSQSIDRMFCPNCCQSGSVDDNQNGGAIIGADCYRCQNCQILLKKDESGNLVLCENK